MLLVKNERNDKGHPQWMALASVFLGSVRYAARRRQP